MELTLENLSMWANLLWMLLAAFLVFFMQAGFAMVEAGFVRAKNAGNVLIKNVLDFAMGTLAFWAVGFGIMFGKDIGGFLGFGNFFFSPNGATGDGAWALGFFMFQLVFAATAATIVSGAMAGRTKFSAYLIYSFFVSLVIYPIAGHWSWGGLWGGTGGWLEKLGYIDFAGSSVVHMLGGVLGLTGAIFLGPRFGKYRSDGGSNPIPGHNLPIAALGVFILWFGWYGFNPGSTTSINATDGFALIAVNTTLAAAAATIAALIVSWVVFKAPDIGMTLNGALAGLVAITAPCATVDPWVAVIIGAIGGVLVVFSVLFVDRVLKIDDPVGAFSVHGVNGFWGVISVGFFDTGVGLFYGHGIKGLGIQVLGALSIAAWAAVSGSILFGIIKAAHGLRVSREEEIVGLDLREHKADSYPDFRKNFTKM